MVVRLPIEAPAWLKARRPTVLASKMVLAVRGPPGPRGVVIREVRCPWERNLPYYRDSGSARKSCGPGALFNASTWQRGVFRGARFSISCTVLSDVPLATVMPGEAVAQGVHARPLDARCRCVIGQAGEPVQWGRGISDATGAG